MLTLAEAALRPASDVGEDAAPLAAQGRRGLVILPDFEEGFYRGNNLPEQLARLFRAVNPARIDEDSLEPLADKAQALIRTSYLMDDAVQQFYRALGRAGLVGRRVQVRRPGAEPRETVQATPPGTPALQALKRVWAADWTFEAVLARLDQAGSVALESRPTLILEELATPL